MRISCGDRVARGLLLVALGGVLVDAGLAALGERTAQFDTLQYLRGALGINDSWSVMTLSHAYLKGGHPTPLYDWIFFEHGVKMTYPPTVLLPIELLDRTVAPELWAHVLFGVAWILVAATAVLTAAILERGLARSGGARAGRGLRVAAVCALTITFYPIVKAYTLGQVQVWVNALIAGLIWCWLTGRKGVGGALLALACAIKPHYAVIGLWGVLRREWRFVGVAAAVGLAVLGASLALFGYAHHGNYLDMLAHMARLGEAYYPNQSVNGLLHRLLGHGPVLEWDASAYPSYDPIVHAGTLAAAAAVLGVTLLWPVRADRRGDPLDLCAMVLATTLASPIAWEHHYGVLLPIFACLLPPLLGRPVLGRFTWPVLIASFLLASRFLPITNRLVDTYWNPLQSYLLAAALAVWGVLLAVRHSAPKAEPETEPRCRAGATGGVGPGEGLDASPRIPRRPPS